MHSMDSGFSSAAKSFLGELGKSLLSILLALGVGALIILTAGENPLHAFGELLRGAFGNRTYIANTVSRAVPLIFTGLSVALSSRCGMLNIGAEGQLHLGAVVVAVLGLYMGGWPAFVAVPILLLAGFLGGMLGGLLAGVLKARFQISEVIAAIMLNYVFRLFTSYLATGPFSSGETSVQTIKLAESLSLPTLASGTKLTVAILFVILAAVALYVFLWRMTSGYKLRSVGANASAALASGINAKGYMLLTMALSGGLAGWAGCCEVLGTYHRFIEGFSPSYGFTGIAVAILGRSHPLGVVLTALLFAVLDSGALRMARVTNVSSSVVTVIQSLIIIAVAAPGMIRFAKRHRKGGHAL